MAKNVLVAYALWLVGGALGLHHFYLGRDAQALIWWCVPGGYFGLGWFRDLWRIPEYVRDANDDPDFIRDLADKMRRLKKPPFSWARTVGMLVMGNMLSVIIQLGTPGPDEIGGVDVTWVARALGPAATAVGIWLVGNIGRQKGSLFPPLVACYVASPIMFLGYSNNALISIVGIMSFEWFSKSWRRTVREHPPVWKRAAVLALCGGLYTGLWVSYFYFNLKVTTKDGDEIPFRDAVGNFLKSPAVQEFRKNVGELADHFREHGFWSTLQQLVDNLDPLGEKNALRVLGLKRGASQDDIRATYRDLSKKWHPDRFQNASEKADAHERFVEIQQAYERLSAIKLRRARKNKRSDSGKTAA